MNSVFSWDLFSSLPVVGILRGVNLRHLPPLVTAALSGGLANLEITMNSAAAADQIREAIRLAGPRLNVGAGTVIGLDQLQLALGAGASFIVTPIVEEQVIRRCRELGVPVFPGAFSPTEVVRAWDLGAAMVKVFPAEVAGPGYIKSLKAPLPHIKLLPTGGVDLNTISEYLKAGADGFGIGSPLFNKDRIAAEDWLWIEQQCRAYRDRVRNFLN